jgi:ubiquinol-cytochrome c reductase cytochrome b subunit
VIGPSVWEVASVRYTKENWKWGVEPFFPHDVVHHAIIVVGVMCVFAAVVFWAPSVFMMPEEPADPMNTPAHIKPEWYFLPMYQALKLFPSDIFGEYGKMLGVMAQGVAGFLLVVLPFLDRGKEKNPLKRMAFFTCSLAIILFILMLGFCGKYDDAGTRIIGASVGFAVFIAIMAWAVWFKRRLA